MALIGSEGSGQQQNWKLLLPKSFFWGSDDPKPLSRSQNLAMAEFPKMKFALSM